MLVSCVCVCGDQPDVRVFPRAPGRGEVPAQLRGVLALSGQIELLCSSLGHSRRTPAHPAVPHTGRVRGENISHVITCLIHCS